MTARTPRMLPGERRSNSEPRVDQPPRPNKPLRFLAACFDAAVFAAADFAGGALAGRGGGGGGIAGPDGSSSRPRLESSRNSAAVSVMSAGVDGVNSVLGSASLRL